MAKAHDTCADKRHFFDSAGGLDRLLARNPKPQWIVPISGSWFVETMDGRRVEMGPGDISFGGDQNTRGRKGHLSGTVGSEPCAMMIIQYDSVAAAGLGPPP